MILETERLILRRYIAGDLKDLYEYLSDDEVVKYEPYKAKNLKETEDNLKWRIETEEMGFEREAHLKQNVYFWKDEHGNPLWKDTYIYAKLN